MRMRSLMRSRCGEVYRPVRKPAARRMDSSIAAVEPLPLVPAMWTQGEERCGWPRSSARIAIFARPNFCTRACCGAASSRPSENNARTDSSYVMTLTDEEVESLRDIRLHFLARDDGVEETVLEEKFCGLKAFGQFLTDGLLDDARAGETDQRAGLGDIQVTEHRVAGGDAAGGGIGQYGNERELGFVQAAERRGNFRELHQADHALHHARAAGTGNHDERLLLFERAVDRARNFFADDGAHRTADKTEFHRAADYGTSVQAACGGDDRIVHIEFALRFFQALRVGPGIGELERVARGQACVQLGPRFFIEKHFQAAPRTQAEVVLALGADFPIRFQIFFPNDGAAGIALRPHAFGVNAAFLRRRGIFDRFFFALEPGHGLRFWAGQPFTKLIVHRGKLKAKKWPLSFRRCYVGISNQCRAAPARLSCTDASLRAFPSPGRQLRSVWDARCGPCR